MTGLPFLGDDGQYYLIVTEMEGRSSMATWGGGGGGGTCMSQVTHAVTQTISGPFNLVHIVVPTEAHNINYAAAYSSDEKTRFVFHIGLGDNPPSCNPYFN